MPQSACESPFYDYSVFGNPTARKVSTQSRAFRTSLLWSAVWGRLFQATASDERWFLKRDNMDTWTSCSFSGMKKGRGEDEEAMVAISLIVIQVMWIRGCTLLSEGHRSSKFSPLQTAFLVSVGEKGFGFFNPGLIGGCVWRPSGIFPESICGLLRLVFVFQQASEVKIRVDEVGFEPDRRAIFCNRFVRQTFRRQRSPQVEMA